MATPCRRSDACLESDLITHAYAFDFFQAVRLLERLYRNRKAVGQATSPQHEVVQFSAWLSLSFPASAVQDIEVNGDLSTRPRMTVAFLGLTGIKGVLPVHYTERMLAGKEKQDSPLVQFFDIFNHRIISLFYRAWEKHRPPALYENSARTASAPDVFTHGLFDLIGMGTAGLRGRMQVLDEHWLRYAGLISQRPHSAMALQGILHDRFGVPIAIEQFVGSWYSLNEFDKCYLAPAAERSQLGIGAFLGDKVWDQQGKFRIRVGALDIAQFAAFLPDGGSIQEMREITRFFTGTAMAFQVQIVLRGSEVPPVQLGNYQQLSGPRLGWNTWLTTDALERDADDAVFAY